MQKQKIIIAFDPGNEQTGWVVALADNSKLLYKNKEDNREVYNKLLTYLSNSEFEIEKIGIEYPSSFGLPVNQTLLDTCTFIGILSQVFLSYSLKPEYIFRKSIKMFLTGSTRSNDSAVNSRVREYVGEDYTLKKPNYWYWNDEVEKRGGARYCNNDMYAAIAVLLYMIYPHDILIQNEKEQERNKISKSLQDLLEEKSRVE